MSQPQRHRRPATLASLAAELGISRTTVSNAYNRPDQLSEELRKRVLEAARRLGYPGPDPVARSLRTRKAGAVGLLLTEALHYAVSDPAALGVLEGLAQSCEDADQGILLIPANPECADRDSRSTVHRAGVDGFVVYGVPEDDPHVAAVLERPVPTVICDQPRVEHVDWVGVDDYSATAELARELTRLGHRSIGVVCMRLGRDRQDDYVGMDRQGAAAFHSQRLRLAALRETFGAHGVDWQRVPVIERFDNSPASGAEAATRLLTDHPGLTAVICTSDILAIGALEAAKSLQLSVPGEISITGFDGVSQARQAGLTTVAQPILDKGREAGKLLANPSVDGKPRKITLPTELLGGSSIAEPRDRRERFFSGW